MENIVLTFDDSFFKSDIYEISEDEKKFPKFSPFESDYKNEVY